MKKFFASKLGKAALIAGAAVVVALVAVVLVVVLRPEEAYRSITVGEVSGQVYVQREGKSDVAAYAGMALFDGDTVRVSADSHMTVVLDGDKHMLAEAGTAFSLEASGKPGSDRTVITLLSGGMLTRLENKLEGEQSYVVQTPTSTIAVRGTVFYVRIELDGNGIPTVHHQVLDGEIEVNPSGDEEQTVLVGAGFSVSVREDGENGIIVRDGNGELIGVIDYGSMSAVIIRELLEYLADGETLVVDEAFLQNLLSPPKHEHQYGAWTSASDTEHKQVCECGESKTNPHNWNAGEVTKEPTHTVEGEKTFTCTDCEHTKTEPVPVTEEHTFAGEWYAGQTGHYQRCAGCGAASEELAHSGGEANCQAQAVCALCHTAYGSYGGHVSSEAWRPSATDGNSHEKYCVLCGTVWSTAPHDWWGEGVVTTPATHMSVGVKTFTCTDCGAARTESIPKITAHEWSRWAVDPTNEDGHMRTCPCGAVERGGHTYGAGVDGTAPNGTPTTVYSCTACMHERFAYKDVLPPTGLNGLFAVDGTAYGDWSSAALALSNDSSAKVTYLLQDIWDYDFSSLFGPVSLPYDNDAFLGGDRPQIPTFTDAGTAVDVPAFYAMTWDLYGHGIRLGAAPRIHEGATWTIRATGGGMMATEGYGLNCFDMGGLLDGTVVILGGMFDFDPTEYVPAGYTVRMVLAPDFFAGTDWDAPTEDYAALIDRFGTYSALINAGNAGTDVYQCRQPGLWIVFAEGSEPAVCDHNVFRACVTVDGVPYDYCSACGETVEHRHNPLWDSYDTEHSQYCIICYETLVEWEAHTLDEGVPGVNDFGEDVMIHHCTVCGRDVVRVLCDGNHIYDRGVESTDEAGNPISLHTCIRCDATTVYTAHACEPDWEHMLYNGNYHWYPCTTERCPAKIYYEEHSYEEDMIVVAPTHDTLGVRATGCFCGHYIAGTESPVEFTGLYIHFDKDCGQPDWSLYADNEMPVTDAFDPARIKVYGLYSDSFDPDSGEVLLTADGTPVYGRLLDPSEYELEYYHCADPDGYGSMRPSTAADATLAGEHLVYVRLLKADGKPDRAHWESFGYTVYVGELEVY